MLSYGYPILFAGVIFESEAFLILGAYLAHRGYFSLPIVIGVAALASLSITQFSFYLGHRYGATFLAKHPRWQPRIERVQQLTQRYGVGLVLGYRALYGMRGLIPAAMGLANYPRVSFLLYNAIGVSIWAVVVALAGNHLARFAEQVFDELRAHESTVIVVILSLGFVWGVYQLYRQSRLQRPIPTDPNSFIPES